MGVVYIHVDESRFLISYQTYLYLYGWQIHECVLNPSHPGVLCRDLALPVAAVQLLGCNMNRG